jgi:hypothetical protein
MIPAILAAPLVQGAIGEVLNLFSPTTPAPVATTATSSASFNSSLSNAAANLKTASFSSSGVMQADQWNQMSTSDLQSWSKSLSGRHVDATDSTGRTISGVVSGVQLTGNNLSLTIDGHPVSLSGLKQITWSPSVA